MRNMFLSSLNASKNPDIFTRYAMLEAHLSLLDSQIAVSFAAAATCYGLLPQDALTKTELGRYTCVTQGLFIEMFIAASQGPEEPNMCCGNIFIDCTIILPQ
jgi:hypothetical protein